MTRRQRWTQAQLLLFRRMKETHVVAVYILSLLIVSIAAQSSQEREWKSLGNPYNRDLFFKFLKSYITGRGAHMMNPGIKDKLESDLRTDGESKYSNLRQYMDNNEIVDI
ncbi:uncharacterized protein C2orf66 homolog [Ranitomeya imitator]|uniref:uncharacterized protein C2orf66 homolog n=1 Tax=Ranitomeya imitator TaxID=111125 RepID=UPI0037E7A189